MEAVVRAAADWAGRRVFITGHTGFKGAWLALWLKRRGARLTGYALPPPEVGLAPSLYQLADVAQTLEREHLADVRDAARLRQALHDAQPEVVFHLAAQALVRESYLAPLDTFNTNVMGTAHLLEAVRHCASVRAVVVVTSDKCYRDLGAPCVEGDALGGHDPYSASKACAELVSSSYAAAFALPQRGQGVATARAGNVIGGGDWTRDRLLPDVLRAIDEQGAITLRYPAAVRPWQHVLEPLSAYLLLAEALLQDPLASSGAWNFGPELHGAAAAVPVQAVVQQLLALVAATGVTTPSVHAPRTGAPHEAAVLLLDSSKAQQQLHWRPRLSLQQALQHTWVWHQAWRRGADMRQQTLQQIADYEALVAKPAVDAMGHTASLGSFSMHGASSA